MLTYMFRRMYSCGQLLIKYNFRKINILQFNPMCSNMPFCRYHRCVMSALHSNTKGSSLRLNNKQRFYQNEENTGCDWKRDGRMLNRRLFVVGLIVGA